MVKTSLLTFAVLAHVSSASPVVIEDGFTRALECNNRAIELSGAYPDIGCVALDENGLEVKFEKSNQPVRYIYGVQRQPDIVIETRRR